MLSIVLESTIIIQEHNLNPRISYNDQDALYRITLNSQYNTAGIIIKWTMMTPRLESGEVIDSVPNTIIILYQIVIILDNYVTVY